MYCLVNNAKEKLHIFTNFPMATALVITGRAYGQCNYLVICNVSFYRQNKHPFIGSSHGPKTSIQFSHQLGKHILHSSIPTILLDIHFGTNKQIGNSSV